MFGHIHIFSLKILSKGRDGRSQHKWDIVERFKQPSLMLILCFFKKLLEKIFLWFDVNPMVNNIILLYSFGPVLSKKLWFRKIFYWFFLSLANFTKLLPIFHQKFYQSIGTWEAIHAYIPKSSEYAALLLSLVKDYLQSYEKYILFNFLKHLA